MLEPIPWPVKTTVAPRDCGLGTLLVSGAASGSDVLEQEFLRGVYRSLALAGLGATAVAMALGLVFGQIENSHLRVLRMIGLMAVRGGAFADDINAFNKTMNLGNHLAQWFTAEFGSTQCRAITQCDFSTTEGVQRYIDGGGAAQCSAIAQSVARRVLSVIQPADTAVSAASVHGNT